jgi:hypothetical protein
MIFQQPPNQETIFHFKKRSKYKTKVVSLVLYNLKTINLGRPGFFK